MFHDVARSSAATLLLALTFAEMTNAVTGLVTAILGGLALLYAARTARIVAIRETTKLITPMAAQLEEMVPIVKRVDTHVNSEKDRANAELEKRDLEIELLREMVIEYKKDKALLAQAKATTDMTSAVAAAAIAGASVPTHVQSQPPVSDAATKSLKEIDKNTAAIEKNTKATDITVQELKEDGQ